MITQKIDLNLIHGQVRPRVNVSQYDTGTRTLQMLLYNGDQAFNIPTGYGGFVQGTKPDRTGFQYAATVTEGSNVVTLVITQQMTAVSGEVTCELVIASGNDRIATVNFILYVEPAALADDTVISDTELPLIEEAAELAQRIDGIVQQVNEDAQTASNAATAAQTAADEAEEWGTHPPYIGANGNWYVYDPKTETYQDSGIKAQGPLSGLTDVEITNAQDGQEITYDGTTQKWKNTSKIQTLTNQVDNIKDNYQSVKLYHNIPRLVPKDITSYITDGTLYKRLNGTYGFALFEDIYVGDYIHMSRAISAKEITGQYQATGSNYVTIAAIDWYLGNGDTAFNYPHLVMVPGKGFDGTQHFGRSRMNSTNDTTGGYTSSEMHTTTIGAVASSGSTASDATINQQLYAEFGSHLKTTRELLSNAMDSTRTNRFGQATGATSGFAWASCQAVLMSEIEVYGSIVFSSAGQDTGNACAQLPLFAHSKQAINNRSGYYWLKDVASAADFCHCSNVGYAGYHDASDADRYVRPRFILA